LFKGEKYKYDKRTSQEILNTGAFVVPCSTLYEIMHFFYGKSNSFSYKIQNPKGMDASHASYNEARCNPKGDYQQCQFKRSKIPPPPKDEDWSQLSLMRSKEVSTPSKMILVLFIKPQQQQLPLWIPLSRGNLTYPCKTALVVSIQII